MALVVYDRVQETTSTTGTGTITLDGAIAGFQSFAVVGDGNTTFYTIINGSQWEVGLGTYSTTGPTLARTTVYSNSNGNTSPITLSGGSSVFVTYPAERSVNLDASGNVTALGTVSSGTWQGTTVGVAYGGTGVTSSSGANSVVLRDANANVVFNNFTSGFTAVTAAAGTTVLTVASTRTQVLIGSTTQTIQLPDATTLQIGQSFIFVNNSSGVLTITNGASAAIDLVPSGGAVQLGATSIATVAGTWGIYSFLPGTYNFSIPTADFGNATIINANWQGDTIQPAYGGTGLTTFAAADNALYSTGASTLTAGTLPVAAGGTGLSTLLGSGAVLYATSTTTIGQDGNFTYDGSGLYAPNFNPFANLNFVGTGNRITGDFSNATFSNRVGFQSSTTNGNTIVEAIPNGTAVLTGFVCNNSSDVNNSSGVNIVITSAEARLQSSARGTGTYLPLTMFTNALERLRIDTDGNVGIGTSSPTRRLQISASGSACGIRIDNTVSGRPMLLAYDDSQNLTLTNSSDTGYYAYVNGTGAGTERMRIDSSGNVGIGTDSPATALDVQRTSTNAVINVQTNTSGNATFQLVNSGNATSSITQNRSANNLVITNGSSGSMTFVNNGSERMRITSTGAIAFSGSTNYGGEGQALVSNGGFSYPVWTFLSLTSLPSAFVKKAPKVATVGNITLNGFQTIDGVSVGFDDRVLVRQQTTSSENGIYDVQIGAWSRSPDANSADYIAGALTTAEQGSQAGLLFNTPFKTTDTLGTTAMNWGLVPSSSYYRTNTTIAGGNDTTLRSVIGVGIVLAASTIYEIEGQFWIAKTAGTTSSLVRFQLGAASGLTANNLQVQVQSRFGVTVTALEPVDQYGNISALSTNIELFAASTTAAVGTIAKFKGTISVNAGGTLYPYYSQSAASGGAWTAQIGNYMKVTPLGPAGVIDIGNWA